MSEKLRTGNGSMPNHHAKKRKKKRKEEKTKERKEKRNKPLKGKRWSLLPLPC